MLATKQQGFTLLELIVVMVLVGIIFGIGIASVDISGNQTETIKREAERLRIITELARDEAIVQSSEYGLQLFTGGYRWFELVTRVVEGEDGETQQVDVWELTQANDYELKPHKFTEGVTASLLLGGLEVEVAELPKGEFPAVDSLLPASHPKSQRPSMYALSSGEMSEFEITFAHKDALQDIRLSANLLGDTKVEFLEKELNE